MTAMEELNYLENERHLYENSTHDIISKVAYLIGVSVKNFENEHEPPKIEIYDALEKNKAARIIRNLCIVRTAIERNFGKINKLAKKEFKSIYTMPEFVPQDALRGLETDGIRLNVKTNAKLNQYIIEINKHIRDRINNCKDIFPVWLNWDYIRNLFNMNNGLTEAGILAAADVYFANMGLYPYGAYINWSPAPYGNILQNDKKFVTLLYEWNNDFFTDYSKVSDVAAFVKTNIHGFIEDATKIDMVVDCENSDPYRLSATLKGLDADLIAKINKIILMDDIHTTEAWRILETVVDIPVEHIMTERVKRSKSLVDIELTAKTCKEHYVHLVDSFLLVSSDSDYWGLIKSLPEANFLVMVERENCGSDMKAALASEGIFYCYIDDFYTGDGEELKRRVLFKALDQTLNDRVQLNIQELFDSVLTATRIDMEPAAKKQFYNKHIKPMTIQVDDSGKVTFEFKK